VSGAEPDDVRLDLERGRRLGLDEAVLAGPKSVAQLTRILELGVAQQRRLLFTRLAPEQHAALPEGLAAGLDYDEVSRTAVLGGVAPARGSARVGVVCAGTSDRPVAAEAERTLAYAGVPHLSISDVGVAGLWRLLERVDELRALDAVIAVAGMDGAMPTVIAGLVPGLVVAVPTSVGYGVAGEGTAALHSALTSCAPGLVVVNIDNGYGAACAAMRSCGVGRAQTDGGAAG
jgi:NCAIR mutase (PurE)-related protein